MGGDASGAREVAGLSLPARAAVTVAALMAARRIDALLPAAQALAAEGAAAADLREAAYVASLFCGFPTGVAALVALGPLGEGATGTVAAYDDHPPGSRGELRTRGEELFRTIHRRNAARQLDMLAAAHRDFADTVIAEAYGRVLARPFLPLDARELIAVACLAVLDLRPQLRGHLLACRNCGASWPAIASALDLALGLASVDAAPARALAAELERREA